MKYHDVSKVLVVLIFLFLFPAIEPAQANPSVGPEFIFSSIGSGVITLTAFLGEIALLLALLRIRHDIELSWSLLGCVIGMNIATYVAFIWLVMSVIRSLVLAEIAVILTEAFVIYFLVQWFAGVVIPKYEALLLSMAANFLSIVVSLGISRH